MPAHVKSGLSSLHCRFPDLKWADAQRLHLTLRFIGDIPSLALPEIRESLLSVKFSPFTLCAKGLGLFQRRRGAVLWAGISTESALFELRDKVDKALNEAGLNLKAEKFSPHITLSRLKTNANADLKRFIQENESNKFGDIRINEFILFRSILQPCGATHEIIARYSAQQNL